MSHQRQRDESNDDEENAKPVFRKRYVTTVVIADARC